MILEWSRLGISVSLVSLEKNEDLEPADRLVECAVEFGRSGVTWHWEPFDSRHNGAAALANVRSLLSSAMQAVRRNRPALIVARGYVPATVALALRGRYAIPYVFDFRGYWIDERRAEGQFRRPLITSAARLVERQLFRRCAAAVSLTELAAADIRGGKFGSWRADKPLVAIPTCADYDTFVPQLRDKCDRDGLFVDKYVIAYVGAINASYHTEAAIDIFKRVRAARADAHLLCLTKQRAEMTERLRAAGVDASDYTIAVATHDQMPTMLAVADWGLLLLANGVAKRASMPTKLAEFFAAGVRPVAYGCNEEVLQWVEKSGGGIVLASLSEADRELAAKRIASSVRDPNQIDAVRSVTGKHFGLRAGASRYVELFRSLTS